MEKRTDRQETLLNIGLPMTADERERFEAVIRAGGYVKGRWVKQAILEKIARDGKQ